MICAEERWFLSTEVCCFMCLVGSVMLVGGRDLLSFLFLIWLEGVIVKWSSMEELFFFLVGWFRFEKW